jgi:electron transport complex protein RnfD
MPDVYAGATLLGYVKTEFSRGQQLSEILAHGDYSLSLLFFGLVRGSLGETSTLALLAGGLWLIRQKVISWEIPVSILATVFVLASLFNLMEPERYPGPLLHIGSGGLMLLAFFIATDYVTCPNSPLGQVLFGVGCGVIVYVIRTWGAFPEGAGFAVLLMNAMTPIIDHYVRPRIYGRDLRGRPLELEGRE